MIKLDLLKEFEGEYNTAEEAEKALDDTILTIGRAVYEEDNKSSIVNIHSVKKVAYVYKLMKFLTRGTNAKVEYHLNEPFKSMGSVTIVGKHIPVKNVSVLIDAVQLASNIDIYVRTDKTVEIDLTFHGLTIK